jgi:plasmid stabilization system protein ParE
MQVILSSRAQADLNAIKSWLTQPGAGPRAHGRLAEIVSALERLGTEARRWPAYLRADTPNIRRRSVAGHTVIYEIAEDVADGSSLIVFVHYIHAPGRFRG